MQPTTFMASRRIAAEAVVVVQGDLITHVDDRQARYGEHQCLHQQETSLRLQQLFGGASAASSSTQSAQRGAHAVAAVYATGLADLKGFALRIAVAAALEVVGNGPQIEFGDAGRSTGLTAEHRPADVVVTARVLDPGRVGGQGRRAAQNVRRDVAALQRQSTPRGGHQAAVVGQMTFLTA